MKRNRFADISGPDEFGHTKANIVIQHNLSFSDGTTTLVQEHIIYQKPIISVFRSPSAAELRLIFESNDDADLYMAWQLLMEYSDPANSITWTAEELESGTYIDEEGEVHPVYFHTLDVVLVPIGHEEEYQMHGYNPIYYSLRPSDPSSLIPNVLQLVFSNEWFTVLEHEDTSAEFDS